MTKISSEKVLDVIQYDEDKVIIVENVPSIDPKKTKAKYYIYNVKTQEKEVITKNAYLMKKFGSGYKKIAKTIAALVKCSAVILSDRNVFVVFPNGQCGMFDPDGNLLWTDRLTYRDKVVNALALQDDYVWCVCKEENCVIRYTVNTRVLTDIRIGSREAKTFLFPTFVSTDDKFVYVCCNKAKLRAINVKDYSVKDIGSTVPGLERFYRFGNHELICTGDGAYID